MLLSHGNAVCLLVDASRSGQVKGRFCIIFIVGMITMLKKLISIWRWFGAPQCSVDVVICIFQFQLRCTFQELDWLPDQICIVSLEYINMGWSYFAVAGSLDRVWVVCGLSVLDDVSIATPEPYWRPTTTANPAGRYPGAEPPRSTSVTFRGKSMWGHKPWKRWLNSMSRLEAKPALEESTLRFICFRW